MLKEKQRDKNSNSQNPTTASTSTNQGPGGGGTGPGPGGGGAQNVSNGNNSVNNSSGSGRGTPNTNMTKSSVNTASPNSNVASQATTSGGGPGTSGGGSANSSQQQSINNSNNSTNISSNNNNTSNKNSNSNNQASPSQNSSAIKEEQLEQGATPTGGSNSNDSHSNLHIKMEEESPPNCGSNAIKKENRTINNGSIKEDCSSNDELLNNEDSTNLNSHLQQQHPGGNQQTPGQMGGSGMQIKTEDMANDPLGASDFLNNIQQSQLTMPGGGGGGRMGMQPQTSIDGTNVQPLPSNVMNKQSNSMEYMQQQSQIFVFSSKLANTSAEAVISGQFPTIIAYHCAQPGTKKFLEKHPLKLAQFNRQNPAQWINNLSLMKNKNNFRQAPGGAGGNNMAMANMGPMGKQQPFGPGPGMMGPQGPGNPHGMNPHNMGHPGMGQQQMGQGGPNPNFNMSIGGPDDLLMGGAGGPDNTDLPQWDAGHGLDSVANGLLTGGGGGPGDSGNVGLDVDNLVPSSPMQTGPTGSAGASNNNNNMSNLQQQSPPVSGAGPMNAGGMLGGPQSPSLCSGGLQPSLQGVKVPDENLTPQQRQHREEQLATIRRMQKMFFPDQGGGMGQIPPDCGMGLDADAAALAAAMSAGGPGGGGGVGPNGPNPQNPCAKMGHPNNMMMNPGPGMGPGQNPGMLRGMMPGGMRPRGGGGMMNRPMGPGMMNANNMAGVGPNAMNDQIMGGPLGNDGGGGPMNENMNAMNCGPMGQGGGGGMMNNMGGHGPMMQGGNGGGMMGQMGMGGGNGPNQMMGGPMGGNAGMMGPGGGGMMGPGNMMGGPQGPGGMMGQKPGCMMGGPGGGPHNTVQAQMEWNKLQHQYFEEQRKGKGIPGHGGMMMGSGEMGNPMGNVCMPGNRQQMMRGAQSGPRSQGPPPPYHQTPRSASVPISTQSPNPSSPNNPTSNLSLPSPRGGGGGSTLNSPADPTRGNSQQSFKHLGQSPTTSQDSPAGPSAPGGAQPPQRQMSTHSNPGTPISANLSPNASLKDIELGSNQTNNQNNSGKEPNLMPVPSPQQIQYLNTFEGQELTIQKQPNTNVKEGGNGAGAPNNNSLISPTLDSSFGNISGGGPMSGPNTPSTPSSMEQRFSGPLGSANSGGNQQSGSSQFPPIPSSPHTPTPGGVTPISSASSTNEKNLRISSAGPSPQSGARTPQMNDQGNNENRFPSESPGLGFPGNQQGQKHPGGSGNTGPGGMKMGNFMNVSPKSQSDSPSLGGPQFSQAGMMPTGGPGGGPGPGGRQDLPLNPNNPNVPNPKVSHFDPISSLAQMSQQLTSSVSALNGGPGAGVGPGGGMSGPGMVGPGGMGISGGQMMGPGGYMSGGDMNAMGGMGGMSHHGHHPMDGMGMGGGPMDCMPGPMGMGGPGGMGGGPMGYGGGMGGSLSPKLGGQMMPGAGFPGGPGGGMPRMMGRPMGPGGPYNGANIQVKASAPNTIQYLPARGTQVGNPNPRGPPSLEFLQRFANPNGGGMDGKQGNQGGGMPSYFGNCNQGGPMGGPGGMGGSMMDNGPMDGPMGGGPMGGPMGGGPMGGPPQMMSQNMMRMRPQGQMGMRMNGPPHGMFNNGGPGAGNMPDGMFPGGGAGNQMFGPGGPGGPGGGAGHNAGAGGGNKGAPLGEANYAQQYHNFQQQLYATNNRVQQGGPGGNQAQPNNQQPFFVQNK